jgi:Helicase conserved C-terminal domain
MSNLADHLRALPDDDLAALVRLRPDLVIPVPADFSALASRAQSRLSVARALDGLDRFTLEVLDALRLTRTPNTTSVAAVLALTAQGGTDEASVRAAIDRLRGLVLVYGYDTALHVVSSVDEVCSPYPAGLGRPAAELDEAAADLVRDAAGLRRMLLAAPPQARAVLDRLAVGPPVGTVGAALRTPDQDSPVGWLVAHRLLVPVTGDTVELPREVALLLRRDAGPLGPMHPAPPAIVGTQRETKAVDQAAAGQAMEAVRSAGALIEGLAAEPPPVLRAGGVGVRELRRLARVAGVDAGGAALLLEVAYAAGLIGESVTENAEAVLLPALGYDTWRASPIAVRWSRLTRAWLDMSRAPALVGQRDERDRLIAALSAEVERGGAPSHRRSVLGILAGLEPGTAPSVDEVGELLAWRTPRRAGRGAGATGPAEVLGEVAALGITGLGALSGYARRLIESVDAEEGADGDPLGVQPAGAGDTPDAVAMLHELLPEPADQVVIQADLTLVAPGPPGPDLTLELAAVTEPESANVFRVTAESIRRALDAGYAASDLHALFARRSRTRVPQALTYLVDDVARRHGGLRAGSAGAYLRSDDEALIAEVAADRRLAALSLRRLAPTVLTSPYAVSRLLAALREAGYAPMGEDATGAAVLTRPKARRAAARPPLPTRREDPLAMPRLNAPRLAGLVEQIRRGDAAARAARRAPVSVRATNGFAGPSGAQAHTQALAVLQQALRDRARVWVGYVDAHGAAASRLVRPISMGSGFLRAEDERTEMLHTFALHRITGAAIEE